MRVLDLFSGIGGFSLGLERAGMRTVAFCEIDPFCRRVLAKHWPGIPIYEDVRALDAPTLQRDGIAVDIIAGGFPCQDISSAGKRAGLAGPRSGLWREYARLIGEVRPRFAIVENVADLRARGLGEVLGDLAALGYDALWESIPASAVGAPHRRDRVWIVAHADDGQQNQPEGEVWAGDIGPITRRRDLGAGRASADVSDAHGRRRKERAQLHGVPEQDPADRHPRGRHADGLGHEVADAHGEAGRSEAWDAERGTGGVALCERPAQSRGRRCDVADADSEQAERIAVAWPERDPWEFEPDVGRVAPRLPGDVDRLRALGNSVVPQIPEIIGRAIMKAHGLAKATSE
jgi:DNA (cytosine-5)-methyltransferase 1